MRGVDCSFTGLNTPKYRQKQVTKPCQQTWKAVTDATKLLTANYSHSLGTLQFISHTLTGDSRLMSDFHVRWLRWVQLHALSLSAIRNFSQILLNRSWCLCLVLVDGITLLVFWVWSTYVEPSKTCKIIYHFVTPRMCTVGSWIRKETKLSVSLEASATPFFYWKYIG